MASLTTSNTLRFVWDEEEGVVYVEMLAKHGGSTVIASAVKVSRVAFSDAVKRLGAVS